MNKSRTLILKTGLCGLALSSLFLLNNKSVVHADTVDGTQNNAISWNSDSDAVQNVQNTQKADDDQQNAQSVQPSRAETITVRSVSATPRTTNQNTPVQSPRVANVQDAQKTSPVVINNPANNKVHVHYIDANGDAVDNSSHDYDIDATKTGQGSYTVPNGYSLNVPDGKYNVNGGKFGVDMLKGNVEHHAAVTHKVTQWAEYDDDGQYKVLYGMSDYAKKHAEQEYKDHVLAETGDGAPKWQKQTKTITDKPAYDVQHLPVAFVDSSNNIVGMIQNYTGKAGTSQNINLSLPTGYKLADGQTMPTSVTFADNDKAQLIKVVPDGTTKAVSIKYYDKAHVKFVDQQTGQDVGGSYDIDLHNVSDGSYSYKIPAGYGANNSLYNISHSIGLYWNIPYVIPSYAGFEEGSQQISLGGDSKVLSPSRRLGLGTDNADKLEFWIKDKYFNKVGHTRVGYPSPGILPISVESIDNGLRFGRYQLRTDPTDQLVNGDYYDISFSDPDVGSIVKELSDELTKQPKFEKSNYWMLYMDEPYREWKLNDTGNIVQGDTITVPVHKSTTYQFVDPSGNAKSAQGNTVDVTLTKPQSVNPATDARCQSQATRTIQINFPDGQVPKSYDGIVDKSGKLVQTVHFTRTATEDALTGNILQYGSWTSDNQDHNFLGFEARTLPRIPGYTLSIKPA